MRRSTLLVVVVAVSSGAALYANHSLAEAGEPFRARFVASFGTAVGAAFAVLVVMRLWLGRRG